MLTAYYAFQITYSGFHLGLNTINLGGGGRFGAPQNVCNANFCC